MRRVYSVIVLVVLTVVFLLLFMRRDEKSPHRFPLSPFPTPIKPIHPKLANYIDFIEAEIDSTQTVGAALTIVHNNEIVATRTYGYRQKGDKQKVNEHTVFRLASVSKGFAGVLAAILEEDSIFSLNDKVIEYLPELKLKDSVNTADLTIEHTLSHSSGLVPHAFDNLIEDGVPLKNILSKLVEVDISAEPGILYGYQNVVFSMIDTIVRVQTNKTYSELLDQKIFHRLKMHHASATSQVFEKRNSNIAYPHMWVGSEYAPIPLNLGYYNISPAAGVNASIEDMGNWLLALLGNYPEVLDSTILSKITTPVIKSPLSYRYLRNWDDIDEKYYSLGWRIYIYKGRKIIYHGGYVKGYRAEIAFCPEENIGMAFLQNSPNRLASACVPVFFNNWFQKTDSIVEDTLNMKPRLEFKLFDDTLF